MIFINDGDYDYRVDKTTEGCIIRGNGKFIEANNIVYEILLAYYEGNLEKVNSYLLDNYESTKQDIIEILTVLSNLFQKEEVFHEFVAKIKNMKGTKEYEQI